MLYSQLNTCTPTVVIHRNVILHGISLANNAQITNFQTNQLVTPVDPIVSNDLQNNISKIDENPQQ